jgi:hypothetical protein
VAPTSRIVNQYHQANGGAAKNIKRVVTLIQNRKILLKCSEVLFRFTACCAFCWLRIYSCPEKHLITSIASGLGRETCAIALKNYYALIHNRVSNCSPFANNSLIFCFFCSFFSHTTTPIFAPL